MRELIDLIYFRLFLQFVKSLALLNTAGNAPIFGTQM